jgi:2-polyprenyl-3-methyl-5-hydroxy-6-metoxy-1,4-benzoquinol methylase
LAKLQSFVDRTLDGREGVRVLEAGAGSATRTSFGADAYVVGIDLSQVQLDRHTGLDEKIVADIETHQFEPRSFDVVICWNVLEHMEHPDRALDQFRRAVRDDGIIILGLPNLMSVKGLVTKLTPHRFHVFVHRRVLGRPLAGVDGRGPFPTTLRRSISPTSLRRFAREQGLAVVYMSRYEALQQTELRRRMHLTGTPWRAVAAAMRAVTLNTVETERTDLIVVLGPPRPPGA